MKEFVGGKLVYGHVITSSCLVRCWLTNEWHLGLANCLLYRSFLLKIKTRSGEGFLVVSRISSSLRKTKNNSWATRDSRDLVIFNFFRFLAEVPPTKCNLQVEKSLTVASSPGGFVPRCTKAGFEEVQCSDSSGECWCVDKDGLEVKRTRSRDFIICPSQGKRKQQIWR